ncbi:MAG: hypothetical protein ACU0BB_05085 [Paracoccaceae bacterium]
MPETTSPPEHLFESDSRSVKAMIGVACYLTFVAALWLVFDAVLWIVVLLALLGIPALIQLWKNPHAALTLSYEEVAWSSGAQQGTVLLSGIDKIRMDTRWDLSVRITLILVDGSRLRLPPDVSAAHRELETHLLNLGQKVERHHFVVI